jgi:glycosyltransferase involved in cell wall biosynthesis
LRFSIVINNYNYGRFVGQAIESALAVEWENKEVIVVDDGSTDDSRSVIEQFGGRVVSISTENGGQAQAANVGFGQSTGDVVIFLDADDLLLSSVAREVAAAWGPGVAKVQYGMIYVDQDLRALGRHWPTYDKRYTPELVSSSMRETGDYLMSPTSGNAWNRDFLKKVFPLPTRDDGLVILDTYLGRLAPFFGDVVSLCSPQCFYRRHGENWSSLASIARYLERYPVLLRQVETERRFANQLLQYQQLSGRISDKNEYCSKLAFVSKRFFTTSCPDRLRDLLRCYWRTVWRRESSWRWKAALFGWSLIVATAPRPIAGWFVIMRDHNATLEDKKLLVRVLGRLIPSRT